jgi:hypothetical protein
MKGYCVAYLQPFAKMMASHHVNFDQFEICDLVKFWDLASVFELPQAAAAQNLQREIVTLGLSLLAFSRYHLKNAPNLLCSSHSRIMVDKTHLMAWTVPLGMRRRVALKLAGAIWPEWWRAGGGLCTSQVVSHPEEAQTKNCGK